MDKEKDKKEKIEYIDDGRVIANMNVEGMPWYQPTKPVKNSNSESDFTDLSRKEKFAMLKGILSAALLVGFIFILGYFLFIVFCINVWFK